MTSNNCNDHNILVLFTYLIFITLGMQKELEGCLSQQQ